MKTIMIVAFVILCGCNSKSNNKANWIDMGHDPYFNTNSWINPNSIIQDSAGQTNIDVKIYNNAGVTILANVIYNCKTTSYPDFNTFDCLTKDGDHLPKSDKCYEPVNSMILKGLVNKFYNTACSKQ